MTSTYASAAPRARPLGDPARLRRISRATLVALGVAFLVSVATASGSTTVSGRLGGDYPAFYGAGRVVADGDVDALYDPARQQAAQQGLHGDDESGYLHFAYPPFVAAAYAPLSALPYGLSYAVHTVLMLGAVVLGLHLLRPVLPLVDRHFELCLAATLAFYPMFRAVTAGQNTALTFLLVAWSWRAVDDRRDVRAGVALGLLLFKPQLALLLVALHLLHGRVRIAATVAGVGAALWAAGAALQGPGWLGPWWDQASRFGELDAVVNGANAVSWLGVAQTALGVESTAAALIGWAAAAVTVAVVVAVWAGADRSRLAVPMAVAVAGTLLASPHAMFYDAGLLALAGLAVVPLLGRRAAVAVGALWVVALLHGANDVVGVTPLFVVAVGAFALAVQAREPVGPPPPLDVPGRGSPVRLSVVIPAFQEAARIGPTLESIVRHFDGERVEVLVVDDGSTDGTAEVAWSHAPSLRGLRVIVLPENRGKGHAVRVGMLAAAGEWRLMADADGSTDVAELGRLEAAATAAGAPVAIASIAVDGAEVTTPQRGLRPALGRFGNRMIQLLALPGIEDSQRGFKLFRGDVADDVFSRCRIDRWGFDVEALAIAQALDHEVVEVGVRWEHRDDSRVKPWSYLTTLAEVLQVRRLVGPPGARAAPPRAERGVLGVSEPSRTSRLSV